VKKKSSAFPPPFELLLRVLPDATYVLDAAGIILYANPAVLQHTGWDPVRLAGQSVTDSLLFALPFRSTVLNDLRETGVCQGDSIRIMPDGSLRTVSAVWQKLSEPIGAAHIIGIDHDISDCRTMEEELRQSRKLAKIGILSEGIAHELRNPLSYALSAAQLLNEEGLPDDVRQKCIHTVTTGVKRAGLIVDNLLSLAKPRAQFSRQIVRIEQVLDEALDAASTHSNFPSARIIRRFPAEPLTVHGNLDMLVQVFHNVITNALNEMPDGGTISVEGERDSEAVHVRVSDTGPGVSEEQAKQLFDPFYSESSSGTGTGLGLTLSYYIMKEHAGNIEVESRPGSGATFVLTFPLYNSQ
jgi:PAS domain S-box-containing protein